MLPAVFLFSISQREKSGNQYQVYKYAKKRNTMPYEPYDAEQRRCVNWPKNPPPPSSSNFSRETSSVVSEATVEDLASGLEELEAQQAKMTDATTKLLSVVS